MALHATSRDRHRSAAGFSTLELVAAVAIMGIALRFGVPKLAGGSDLALFQAHEQLVADLRYTRSDALISGDHFQLKVTGTRTYAEYRMALQADGKWKAAAAPSRSRTLPTSLTFTTGVGSRFEFDTRGLLVGANASAALVITDSRLSQTRQVVVWPSGQVQS